jgi:hypothetical protein
MRRLAHPGAAISNKSEATPHLPHGRRVQRALRCRARGRHRSRLPGTSASSTALLVGPDTRRTSTHRAWYALRCAARSLARASAGIAGALRLRDFRPADGGCLGHPKGDSNPRPCGPTSNDLSGRCNRGSRTLDTAVVSCLLSRLSYIAVVDMVASCAGTHSSSAAACQCGWNHNRWRETLTKTSVTISADVYFWALIRILRRRGKRTDLRLPFSMPSASASSSARPGAGTPSVRPGSCGC